MASNQPSSSGSAPATQEYTVRVSKNAKKFSLMKFNTSTNLDFSKKDQLIRMERQNNFRDFKAAYDIDTMPKFGAGSEFGRDQKEEARRKKYGINIRKYVPEAQPWLLKVGQGKSAKRFKGVKEGGVHQNAKYYIFTQCADGAFDAFPVEEWHNFSPQVNYKYLNSEEAEEEFTRRDKTLNYFSVMLKRRLQNEGDMDEADLDEEEKKLKAKAKSKKKDFKLTDLDEWAELSDDDDYENSGEDKPRKDSDDEDKNKKKGNKKRPNFRGAKKRKGTDDEASEDSDDQDEGQEVDYMTDTDSEDEDMYADEVKSSKYEDKGVCDEEGLRKIIDSGDEEEEEETKQEDEEEEEEEGEKEEKKKEESESESSDSGSDSDLEKEGSALFMQKKEKKKGSKDNTPAGSRSATPTIDKDDKKGKKRKTGDNDSQPSKKVKVEPGSKLALPPVSAADSALEEAVRRYLMRKPMTVSSLLQKLRKRTDVPYKKEQLAQQISTILKRLNPEKVKIQDKLFLHLKKTEG